MRVAGRYRDDAYYGYCIDVVRADFRQTVRAVATMIAAMLAVSGCGVGYYWQAATGHMALMRRSEPVADIVADPHTTEALRGRLLNASAALAFAHEALALPDNGSYGRYADLDRRYAVWNVVAAPALSLQPRTWCFPVAGCVSYRGYFRRQDALAFADRLRARGDDVYVGGVPAYSTLGRFADPLLNTMLEQPDERIAALIFHELAHQRLYVRDDTAFNEGFAGMVEREGLRRWLLDRGDERAFCAIRLENDRRREVLAIIDAIRGALQAVYDRDIPAAAKLVAKGALLATLDAAYEQLRSSWSGPPNFDHWFASPFNNARFVALGAYEDARPAFEELLRQSGGDLEIFFTRAAAMGAESPAERSTMLEALRAAGRGAVAPGGTDCAPPSPDA